MRGLSRLLILITTPCLVGAPTAASSSWLSEGMREARCREL